jgi:hypothetical protein
MCFLLTRSLRPGFPSGLAPPAAICTGGFFSPGAPGMIIHGRFRNIPVVFSCGKRFFSFLKGN